MQRGKARGKGVGSLEEESWEYPTGEALTESYPKRLRIELLGGLLGFTDWVRVARAPGGGRRKSRGKRGPLRPPTPLPGSPSPPPPEFGFLLTQSPPQQWPVPTASSHPALWAGATAAPLLSAGAAPKVEPGWGLQVQLR